MEKTNKKTEGKQEQFFQLRSKFSKEKDEIEAELIDLYPDANQIPPDELLFKRWLEIDKKLKEISPEKYLDSFQELFEEPLIYGEILNTPEKIKKETDAFIEFRKQGRTNEKIWKTLEEFSQARYWSKRGGVKTSENTQNIVLPSTLSNFTE